MNKHSPFTQGYAQTQVAGLRNVGGLTQSHKEGAQNYPNSADTPPVGGDHNQVPQSCQVYTAEIANEHAVHSMEHGAVWVTYNPKTATAADIKTLKGEVDGNADRLMSPYPDLKSPISLQAWGEQVFVDKASDPRVKRFLDLFTKGPQTKEIAATCVGTTAPGPLRAAAPTPSGSASPAAVVPSATPTK